MEAIAELLDSPVVMTGPMAIVVAESEAASVAEVEDALRQRAALELLRVIILQEGASREAVLGRLQVRFSDHQDQRRIRT